MEKLAVRGYVEVLRHFFEILSIRRRIERRLIEARPGLFIGIDAPDFNLGLERKLKRSGIRTVHYVSPSLWGWRGGRMASIAKSVDKMLVLFPFEEALYREAGVPVAYVGHPMADETSDDDGTAAAREQLKLPAARKVIALLPGSRQSELHYMASCFAETAKLIAARQPAVHFLVPLISRETRAIFEEAVYAAGASDLTLTVLFGHAREALAACDVALVASGTATLETALAASLWSSPTRWRRSPPGSWRRWRPFRTRGCRTSSPGNSSSPRSFRTTPRPKTSRRPCLTP